MTILIRQAQIIDPSSPYHNSKQDLFIKNGVIEKIGDLKTLGADTTIEHPNLHISAGWVDTFSDFCDPGFEQKETLQTGIRAATAGGFTEVLVIPNTNPVVSGKSQVEYIIQKSKNAIVTIHPLGAVTQQAAGKDLAEMYDMHDAGAKGFTDGINPVQSAGLLLKALQYVKTIDGVIVQIPDDASIGKFGLINEGIISTQLGLPGKPVLAEEIQVARDIKLTRYADSKLHFSSVTSPKSLEYIKRAKEGKIKVSCSVSPAHLYFSDEDLTTYDTNLKLFPPIRTVSERNSLQQAVLNGNVDCIATHHLPQDSDHKVCEFEYASYGMIGLESCYGVMGAVFGDALTPERWVELICTNPRTIFGLDQPSIKESTVANVTLFDPETTYTFTAEHIHSKAKNSAFIGKQLKGKVIAIINKNQFQLT